MSEEYRFFSYIIYIPHNIHSCMRYPTTKAKKERKISLFLFIQNPIKGFMRDSHSYFIQSSHSYLFSLEIIITGSLYKIYVNVFIFSLCLSSEISHKGTLELFFLLYLCLSFSSCFFTYSHGYNICKYVNNIIWIENGKCNTSV